VECDAEAIYRKHGLRRGGGRWRWRRSWEWKWREGNAVREEARRAVYSRESRAEIARGMGCSYKRCGELVQDGVAKEKDPGSKLRGR